MSRKKRTYNIKQPSRAIRDEAADLNLCMYSHYYNLICDIALARYKWHGLPDNIDPRFLELMLLENGSVIAWRDDITGVIQILPFNSQGPLTNQGNPKVARVFSPYSGFNQRIDLVGANRTPHAICYNNFIRTGDLATIQLMSQRIADLDRTIDVNIEGQKTPKYVVASHYQKLTIENLEAQRRLNCPVIYVDETVNLEGLRDIDLTVPYTTDRMDMHKLYLWNDILTFLGIDNANQFKKERLVSAEVNSNEENVEMSRNTNLESRRLFAEWFNREFPEYHVHVEFNSMISKANIMTRFASLGGESNNGYIYNNPIRTNELRSESDRGHATEE